MDIRQAINEIKPDETQKRKMLAIVLDKGEKKQAYRLKPLIATFCVFVIVGGIAAAYNVVRRSGEYTEISHSLWPGSYEMIESTPEFTVVTEISDDFIRTDSTEITPEFTAVTKALDDFIRTDSTETTPEFTAVTNALDDIISIDSEDEQSVISEITEDAAVQREEDYSEKEMDLYGEASDRAELLPDDEIKEKLAGLFLFANPLNDSYYVSSEWDDPYNIYHTGIDLSADRGTAIYAAADGIISDEIENDGFWNNGYGKCVIVKHNDEVSTLYAHCSEVLVEKGQEVKKGDLIARVGNTGMVTGNCLHFELRVGGKRYNPGLVINF